MRRAARLGSPFFDHSIRASLIGLSVTMLALIAGLGTLNYSRLYRVNQTASAIRDQWLPATRDLAEVARLTEHFRMILAMDLLAASPAERASENAVLASTLADRRRAWGSYLQNPLTPEQRRRAAAIDGNWHSLLSRSDKILVLMQDGDHDDAYAEFLATEPLFDDLHRETAAALAANVAGAAAASGRAGAEYGLARIWIGVTLGLGLLLSGAAAAVAIFGISRPILRIAAAMKRLASQDLTVEVEGLGQRGELGEMAKALAVFKANAMQLHEAHAALEQANAFLELRIEERTHELRSAQEELLKKERLSVIGQITATVAHELRNPLSAIRNSAFTLKELSGRSGVPLERPVSRIERSIERCDRIVAELLDYTKSGTLRCDNCSIDAWLSELAPELPQPQGGRIALKLAAGDALVRIDPDRFRRVVINLVENACQAVQGQETAPLILIRSRAAEPAAEIEIEDNGPGIPRENLERVFEPLFSTKSFGTGLGLPTVRQIVEQHDGTIELKSGEGKGTLALIRLPLVRAILAA